MAISKLKERVKQFEILLPFMEGREKGDLKSLLGDVVTINEFGFLKDENKDEYVVFTIKEDTKNFYFGGMVLTQNLQELEVDGCGDLVRKEGLPIRLSEKRSKNKMVYTKVEYYPMG